MAVNIESSEGLKLSDNKQKEFTRPLISHIYGSGDINIQNFEDVVSLYRNPDLKKH
jgi:hypothetical protein